MVEAVPVDAAAELKKEEIKNEMKKKNIADFF